MDDIEKKAAAREGFLRLAEILEGVPDPRDGEALPSETQAELGAVWDGLREAGIVPKEGEAHPPEVQAEVELILSEMRVLGMLPEDVEE